MSNVSVLNVNLYGEPIGTLTNLGGDRTIFAFTDEYIENPDRPTLGLAFKAEWIQTVWVYPSSIPLESSDSKLSPC